MSFGSRILLTPNDNPDDYRFFINGVEYKLKSNWTFTEQIGNTTSSTCTVLVENQEPPQAGDLVEYMNDSNTLFLGICGIPKSPKFSTGNEQKEYQLTCNNANSILSRRLVNESYSNKNIRQIVNDLFTKYISVEGFTLGTISTIASPIFEVYNAKNMNLQEVLNELSNYVNGAWICTPDRVFNFVIKNDFPQVVTINSNNAIINNLQRTDNDKDLRTRQIVDGAYNTTDPQTEEYYVTDDFSNFNTVFPIAVEPTLSIDYGSSGTYTPIPSSAIGVKGIDSENPDKLFLWGYNSNEVVLNRGYTGQIGFPVLGDQIKIVYKGLVAIRVIVNNSVQQSNIAQKTGTSGIIEKVFSDSSITKRDDAEKKANSLLETYREQKITLSASSDSEMISKHGFSLSNFNLYSMWKFNLPNLNIVGDFVITERKITPYILSDSESVIISCKWVNRNFVQSYGETISRLYADVSRLSVREDEVILNGENVVEKLELSEQVYVGQDIALFVTTGLNNGQIAEPLGTLYPWIGN